MEELTTSHTIVFFHTIFISNLGQLDMYQCFAVGIVRRTSLQKARSRWDGKWYAQNIIETVKIRQISHSLEVN